MKPLLLTQVSEGASNNSNGKFLSTGCKKLDSFLRGGLSVGGITQIYGEAGIGKTQLALQLCLSTQISTNNGRANHAGTAYISTDSVFPSKRLQELSKKSIITKNFLIDYKRIFIEHIADTKDLEDCILGSKRLQYLLVKHNIKLLIIDSVAATYRCESNSVSYIDRAKSLRNLGYQLRKLAITHGLTVVCVNQITTVTTKISNYDLLTDDQPSLGITWASMVTNSLCMFRKNNKRYLHVTGSSYLPKSTVEYEILDSGIQVKND